MIFRIANKYQAGVLHGALEIFIQEMETAVHHGSFIDADKTATDDLLTCYNSLEEAKDLKRMIEQQFNLKYK